MLKGRYSSSAVAISAELLWVWSQDKARNEIPFKGGSNFLQDLCSCLTQNSLPKQKPIFVVPYYIRPKLGLVDYNGTGVCLKNPPVRETFPDRLWLSSEYRLQLVKRTGLFSVSLLWLTDSELLPMTEVISLMLPVMPYGISLPYKHFTKDSDFRFSNLTESQWHLSEPDSVPSIFAKPNMLIKNVRGNGTTNKTRSWYNKCNFCKLAL